MRLAFEEVISRTVPVVMLFDIKLKRVCVVAVVQFHICAKLRESIVFVFVAPVRLEREGVVHKDRFSSTTSPLAFTASTFPLYVPQVEDEVRLVNLRPEFPAVPCFISSFALGFTIPIPTFPNTGCSRRCNPAPVFASCA